MAAEPRDRKRLIREQALAARDIQPDKDGLSRAICRTLVDLDACKAARAVLYYLDVRSEVRTSHALQDALASGKKVAVPYCVDGALGLFHLESMEELAAGRYGIPEPKAELRAAGRKHVAVEELDLVVVPGVAFGRDGARLGHGFGYYDRLLRGARAGTPLVGLAFECQILAGIPMADHDVFMDLVVTEKTVHPGRGRAR